MGEIAAKGTFRVIASMNPYDNIGTTRLSTSIHDRFCRLAIGYQDGPAERAIVALRAPLAQHGLASDPAGSPPTRWPSHALRVHQDIRQGASVRGAIDLTDCVHNAGPDPRPFAARLPRLDVLLDTTGEQDRWLGGELARLGRGKLRVAGTYRDVAPPSAHFSLTLSYSYTEIYS